MSVAIVVGVQWGDEGKGKVVDYFTESSDVVVRFQGGNNAGHTIVINGKKSALQLVPSGIMRPSVRCLLASGVVLDPYAFLEELQRLESAGIDVSASRFGIAPEINLVMPYHIALDKEREKSLGNEKIGTTGKGIGPAYEDAVARSGIRVSDLFNKAHLSVLIERNLRVKNKILADVLGSRIRFDASEILLSLENIKDKILAYVVDVSKEIRDAIASNKSIVFEGAQGSLLDITHGTYPFVTSSNTIASYACVSSGFSPRHVNSVIGICKAYTTRVGSGIFPTEDFGMPGELMRKVGHEFGTVTGRPRRCGWLDLVAAKHSISINGVTHLIITKLDVLSGFEKVRIAVAYRQTETDLIAYELSSSLVDRWCLEGGLSVVYEELDAWNEDLSCVRSFDELPQNAKIFLKKIEDLVNCPIAGFSVGPDREQTVLYTESKNIFGWQTFQT